MTAYSVPQTPTGTRTLRGPSLTERAPRLGVHGLPPAQSRDIGVCTGYLAILLYSTTSRRHSAQHQNLLVLLRPSLGIFRISPDIHLASWAAQGSDCRKKSLTHSEASLRGRPQLCFDLISKYRKAKGLHEIETWRQRTSSSETFWRRSFIGNETSSPIRY